MRNAIRLHKLKSELQNYYSIVAKNKTILLPYFSYWQVENLLSRKKIAMFKVELALLIATSQRTEEGKNEPLISNSWISLEKITDSKTKAYVYFHFLLFEQKYGLYCQDLTHENSANPSIQSLLQECILDSQVQCINLLKNNLKNQNS